MESYQESCPTYWRVSFEPITNTWINTCMGFLWVSFCEGFLRKTQQFPSYLQTHRSFLIFSHSLEVHLVPIWSWYFLPVPSRNVSFVLKNVGKRSLMGTKWKTFWNTGIVSLKSGNWERSCTSKAWPPVWKEC